MNTEILVKVAGDISGLTTSLSQASSQIKSFSDDTTKGFQAIGTAGKVVTGAGVALAGGLGFAVKTAMDFESQMSNVKAISGATGDDFAQLSQKAREMGSQTSKTATESAEALGYMALAGWDTQQMLGGLEPILRLSEAGAIDLGRASDLVTDSMSAMGITVKDLPAYLDMVAQASRRSNTDIDALMEAFMITGGTLSSFGVPLEESTSLLGVLANRGYKGAEAGRAMNAIFTNLTSGMGMAGKAMNELGISAFDTNGDFKGLESVLMEVNEATKGMSDEQRAQYVSMIAGKEHLKTFQALLGGLDEEYVGLKDSISNSDGALMDMATTMQDNLAGSFTQLMSAVEELAISIGSALIPILRAMTDGLKSVVDWFNGLNDITKQVIALVGAAASVFMLIVGPLLILISMIPSIVAGFSAIAVLLAKVKAAIAAAGGVIAILKGALISLVNPVTIVIAAIAALVAAFVYFYKTNEEFRDRINDAWSSVVETVTGALQAVWEIISTIFAQIVGIITPVIEKIKEDFSGASSVIADVFGGAFTFISELVVTVINFIRDVIMTGLTAVQEFLAVHGETITAVLLGAYEAIKTGIGFVLEFIQFIIETVLGAISELWAEHGDTVIGFVTAAWDTIQTVVTTVITAVWGVIQNILGSIQELWASHGDTVMTIVGFVFNTIKTIITTVIDVIKTVISVGLRLIQSIFEAVWHIISGIVEIAWGLIETTVQSAIDIVRGIIDTVMNLITGDWEAAWDGIKGIAEDILGNIIDFFESIDLAEIGGDIIKGLADGIRGAADLVKSAVDWIADKIPDWIKNPLDINSPIKKSSPDTKRNAKTAAELFAKLQDRGGLITV